MIHSSKTAYVAIAAHRDSHGRYDAGDIVIVDEPALLPVLFAEGSLDPLAVVDASLFTPGAKVDEPAGPIEPIEPAAVPEPTADDVVTAPVATGHRPAAHRMQTPPRAKARRS